MENGKRMKRRSHRQNNFKAVVYYKTTWLEANTHTHTEIQSIWSKGHAGPDIHETRLRLALSLALSLGLRWSPRCLDGYTCIYIYTAKYINVYVCIHIDMDWFCPCECAYRKLFQYSAYRVPLGNTLEWSFHHLYIWIIIIIAFTWNLRIEATLNNHQKCTLYGAL